MIDKPLNQLNAFFKKAAEDSLDGRAQLMYLHLFNLFNQARWSDSLQITNKDLAAAMNLFESSGKPASIETLYRIRQRLEKKGYIKAKTFKGKNAVEYELIQLYDTETSAESATVTPQNVIDFKNSNVRGIKFYDVPSVEVQETWLKCEGELFKGSFAFGLYDLEKLFGTKELCAAIVTASQANKYDKLTYPLVKKVLENQMKGDSKIGSNTIKPVNSGGKYSRVDIYAE